MNAIRIAAQHTAAYKPTDLYTPMLNDTARDEQLSIPALGLLTLLRTHAPGWKIWPEKLRNRGMGTKAARAAIRQLENAGYIRRTQARDPETGRYLPMAWEIYDRSIVTTEAAPKKRLQYPGSVRNSDSRSTVNRYPGNRTAAKSPLKNLESKESSIPEKSNQESTISSKRESLVLKMHRGNFSDFERYAPTLRKLIEQIGEPVAAQIIHQYRDTAKTWAYFVKAFQSRTGGSGDPIPHSAAPLPQTAEASPPPTPPQTWGGEKSLAGLNHLPEVGVSVGVAEVDASVHTVVREGWTAEKCWQVAYTQLELQLDKETFSAWVMRAALVRYVPAEGETAMTFVIRARTEPARVRLQNALYRNLRRVVSDVAGGDVELVFEVMQ